MNTQSLTKRTDFVALDEADQFSSLRAQFDLPDGLIYLDGNSLGPTLKSVARRVETTISGEWGKTLIKSWNDHGWFTLPQQLGDKIARIIGAPAGSVAVGDTISVNLFKLLGAALKLRPKRKTVLSDSGNFPSDLYVAQGLLDLLGQDYRLKIVAPDDVANTISDECAAVMLTEVDYRTAQLHDMPAITERAHRAGALTVWDLAHSAGAIAVDLAGADADFAVGCTYKYLNGGPGAPAFLYVKPSLQDAAMSPLWGWWGHQAPFAFEPQYAPAPGIARQQCGTQSILAMRALEAALDIWDGVDLAALRRKSMALCECFIARVEQRCGRHGLRLAGPRNMQQRGSHVSFHCREGYAVMQALIAHGVIGDFRAPDMIRFGITPLYTRFIDIWDAVEILARILDERIWADPKHAARKAVT
jgi:kynureninase